MEWEKVFIFLGMIASAVWTYYGFQRTRKDKKNDRQEEKQEKREELNADLEKAHLTESATLRKELREMLGEANDRIDKLEEHLIRANERINQFQATINDLTFKNQILEREKKMLVEDLERREQLFSEQMHSKDKQIESLQNRVGDLEKHVKELSELHVSNG